MTYQDIIEHALLQGRRISYRLCETEFKMNHPPITEAVEHLQQLGFDIREGQNINLNTNKTYKEWRLA